jgi:hypothetical protein
MSTERRVVICVCSTGDRRKDGDRRLYAPRYPIREFTAEIAAIATITIKRMCSAVFAFSAVNSATL